MKKLLNKKSSIKKVCKRHGELTSEQLYISKNQSRCIECLRKSEKEYYNRNSDKIKEYRNKYRKLNMDKLRKYSKKWYQNNKEKSNERKRKWRQKNKESRENG